MMGRTRWLPVLSLLAAACDRAASTTPMPPADAGAPAIDTQAEDAIEAFVIGRGLGATEDEAYAAAREDLARALFDDPAWADLTEVEVHRRGEDPQRIAREGEGRVTATLGLARARAAAVLSAFENAEPQVRGPQAWTQTLRTYANEHLAAHTCLRRRALFGSSCEPPDTTEVDGAVAALIDEVKLVPGLRGGVPVDAQGLARVDGTVYVLWRGLPLPGAAVAVGSPPRTLTTDDHGRVVLPTDEGRFAATAVAFDPGALLGPVAANLAAPKLEVKARDASPRRYALVVRGPGDADPVEAALTKGLSDYGAPAKLEPAQRKRLAVVTKGEFAPEMPEIAQQAAGDFDVVILVDYDCAFASRMGGNRVWYEATGSLSIYDAWSGKSTLHEAVRAKANGVSDASADTAARAKLASEVAERIRESQKAPP